MEKEVSRRSFIGGAASVAAGIAAASFASTALAEESATITYADTIAWDGQYDVVVVGFGGAGASAALAAANAGAGVLLIDKAPDGNQGGNTRYCGQMFMNSHGDVDAAKKYITALSGSIPLDEEIIDMFAQEISGIDDTYASVLGLNKEDFMDCKEVSPTLSGMSPEYPELPGADSITLDCLHNGYSDAYMWQCYYDAVSAKSDSIDVWYESPAKSLIQDPMSKTIIGVVIERGGTELNIRATNGVVLTCGGFENNAKMIRDFTGYANVRPWGTAYNTGDGIKMACNIGADLWHMTPLEILMNCLPVEEGERATSPCYFALYLLALGASSAMKVGPGGKRFMNEGEPARHGKIYDNGEWKDPDYPAYTYFLFD